MDFKDRNEWKGKNVRKLYVDEIANIYIKNVWDVP